MLIKQENMSSNKIENNDGIFDEDDYLMISSNQEDDGDYERIGSDTDSAIILSSVRSLCVVNRESNLFEEGEETYDEDKDENKSVLVNPEESYTYGLIDKKEITKEESLDEYEPDSSINLVIDNINNVVIDIHEYDYLDDNKLNKIKKLILSIYRDLSIAIIGIHTDGYMIKDTIQTLNQYFMEQRISNQKFPIGSLCGDIFYIDLIKYLDENFYDHIKNIIKKCENDRKNNDMYQDMIDEYMYQIEEVFYDRLFISPHSNSMTTKDYWGMKLDFIVDLSEILGVIIIFNCSKTENNYSLVK